MLGVYMNNCLKFLSLIICIKCNFAYCSNLDIDHLAAVISKVHVNTSDDDPLIANKY